MAAFDMSGMSAMADHWIQMEKLPTKEAIKGCRYFRRIPGYIANSPAPSDSAFNLITSVMVGTYINTPSSSSTRSDSPGRPQAVSLPVCSKSSRSAPPLRV